MRSDDNFYDYGENAHNSLQHTMSRYLTSRIEVNNRPMTRQGLQGFQTPTCPRSRMFHDKKYYYTQIQHHMNTIRQEINRMLTLIASNKVNSAGLVQTRILAKQKALAFSRHQRDLNVLNTVVEINISRMKERELLEETLAVEDGNRKMTQALDDFFVRKFLDEEMKSKLEAEIIQLERAIQDHLYPNDIVEYNALLKENKELSGKIAAVGLKIKATKEALVTYEGALSNNYMKQHRKRLLSELRHRLVEKAELQNNVSNESKYSIPSIRNDKADVETLLQIKSGLEQKMDMKQAELKQIVQILDFDNKEGLKKYFKRDRHMKEYSSKYDDEIKNLIDAINLKQTEISLALDYLTDKTNEIMFEEINTIGMNPHSLYIILLKQISKLDDARLKCNDDISVLENDLLKLKRDSQKLQTIDEAVDKLKQDIEIREDHKKSLNLSLASVTTDTAKAKERLIEIDSLLNESELYEELRKEITELEKMEKENEEIRETVKSNETGNENVGELEEIDRLVQENNNKIILQLKKKPIK